MASFDQKPGLIVRRTMASSGSSMAALLPWATHPSRQAGALRRACCIWALCQLKQQVVQASGCAIHLECSLCKTLPHAVWRPWPHPNASMPTCSPAASSRAKALQACTQCIVRTRAALGFQLVEAAWLVTGVRCVPPQTLQPEQPLHLGQLAAGSCSGIEHALAAACSPSAEGSSPFAPGHSDADPNVAQT